MIQCGVLVEYDIVACIGLFTFLMLRYDEVTVVCICFMFYVWKCDVFMYFDVSGIFVVVE